MRSINRPDGCGNDSGEDGDVTTRNRTGPTANPQHATLTSTDALSERHCLWDHDEDDFGLADVTAFTPKRLWIGSANFTASSRRSLEFGFWTEDPALLRGAEEFLLDLIGSSEGIDPDADVHMPERAMPDYDGAAMAEAAAELRFADLDDD